VGNEKKVQGKVQGKRPWCVCLMWNVFRRGERFVPDNTLPVELREVLAGARVEVANRWRNIDNALETLAGGITPPICNMAG
jgi:hypothetical protein